MQSTYISYIQPHLHLKPQMCVNHVDVLYTLEGRLVHAGHAGAVVLTWKATDVNFQRYGTNRRTEVKQTHLLHREEGRGREEKDNGEEI